MLIVEYRLGIWVNRTWTSPRHWRRITRHSALGHHLPVTRAAEYGIGVRLAA